MSEGVEDWTTDPFQVPEVVGRTTPLHLPKKASDRNGTNSYSGMCGMALIIVSWGSNCCLCRIPYYFFKVLLQFKCFLRQTVYFLFEVWAPLGIGSSIWRCLSYWSGTCIILHFHLYEWKRKVVTKMNSFDYVCTEEYFAATFISTERGTKMVQWPVGRPRKHPTLCWSPHRSLVCRQSHSLTGVAQC